MGFLGSPRGARATDMVVRLDNARPRLSTVSASARLERPSNVPQGHPRCPTSTLPAIVSQLCHSSVTAVCRSRLGFS